MGLFASTHTVNGSWGGASISLLHVRDLPREHQRDTVKGINSAFPRGRQEWGFPGQGKVRNNHFFLDWQVLKSPIPAKLWAYHQHRWQDLDEQPQLGWC